MMRIACLSLLCLSCFRSAGALDLSVQKPVKTHAQTHSAFLVGGGQVCIDGFSRDVEGALALKKSSPRGNLYKGTWATHAATCLEAGFTKEGKVDSCYPSVKIYHKRPTSALLIASLEMAALSDFQKTYNLTDNQIALADACSCHTGSTKFVQHAAHCTQLKMYGSYTYTHPEHSNKAYGCVQGPYVYMTRVLATVKTSTEFPLHLHDQVAPIECERRTFPKLQKDSDGCYPLAQQFAHGGEYDDVSYDRLYSWMTVLAAGGHKRFLKLHKLDEKVFGSDSNCNCLPGGLVLNKQTKTFKDACQQEDMHSPIKDWWGGPDSGEDSK